MSDNDYTWRAAVADAHTAAAEAFAYAVENGENLDESQYDAAHDFADGSEWVIYTYRARCLWLDSVEVQGCEDDALECVDASADIDSRIRLCVYCALVAEYVNHWQDLAEAYADSEGAAA